MVEGISLIQGNTSVHLDNGTKHLLFSLYVVLCIMHQLLLLCHWCLEVKPNLVWFFPMAGFRFFFRGYYGGELGALFLPLVGGDIFGYFLFF